MTLAYQGTTSKEATLERFWSKVDRHSPSGCWVWTAGHRTSNGYGRFQAVSGGPTVVAHRFAYELAVGVVTPGMVLDHLCRNRLCVRPDHLEMVTTRENILRGESVAAGRARQTHCVHGHAFTEDNTIRLPSRPSQRYCRACKYERAARKRAAARHEWAKEAADELIRLVEAS